MRILLLTDGTYPYVMGGMQKHSFYLAKHLSLAGVDVHLVHCTYFEDPPKGETERPEFQEMDLSHVSFSGYRFPEKGKLPGHYIRENKAYSRLLFADFKDRLHEFDLIYAQGYTGYEFIRQRLQGKQPLPVYVNFHGYEMWQPPPSWKVKLQHLQLRGITKWMTLHADFSFSFGAVIAGILDHIGLARPKAIEIPLGIEPFWLAEDIRPTSEKRSFFFLGRYERRKGIEELSAVLEELIREDQVNFDFHFIGPIPEAKRLKHPGLVYHGQINEPSRIQEIIAGCDVLVCPSHSEGMPTVIMESMAAGKAIIGTDVGAVRKQIQGNGWLLPRPDKSMLKKAILEAAALAPEKMDAMKHQSMAHVREKFVWPKVIQQVIAELERTLAEVR